MRSSIEHDLRKVLDIVGNQLVSLKCDHPLLYRSSQPTFPPTLPFKVAGLPRLRFLEINGTMLEGVRTFMIPARQPHCVLTSAHSSIRASYLMMM